MAHGKNLLKLCGLEVTRIELPRAVSLLLATIPLSRPRMQFFTANDLEGLGHTIASHGHPQPPLAIGRLFGCPCLAGCGCAFLESLGGCCHYVADPVDSDGREAPAAS